MKRGLIAIMCSMILVPAATRAADAALSYPLEAMIPRANWSLDAWGDRGATAWDGRKLTADFSRSLAGRIDQKNPHRNRRFRRRSSRHSASAHAFYDILESYWRV